MHSNTQKPQLVVDKLFLNDKLSISFIKIIIKINTFYAFVNTFNEYLIKTASMVVKSDSKYLIAVVWRFKIIFLNEIQDRLWSKWIYGRDINSLEQKNSKDREELNRGWTWSMYQVFIGHYLVP